MKIQHARVSLALHELQSREGPRLLLLHGLFGSSRDWPPEVAEWPGGVHALDFCGHGESGWVRGGVYTAELLLADADVALSELGGAAVAGAGIGAYVALLLAGARREHVPAALLLPGAGLAGGGADPDFERMAGPDTPFAASPHAPPGVDPHVGCLDHDVRPVRYAREFAERAQRLLLCEDETARPPWWDAVRACPPADRAPDGLADALRALAASVPPGEQSAGIGPSSPR